MDKVQHFEIPYEDKERAFKFYQETFDWRVQDMPEMRYSMVYTTEVDDKMMTKETNVINGGMLKRDDTAPNPVIVVTIDNMDEAVERVKSNGGEVAMEPVQVGVMGMYARFKDTEGNVMALWQNLKK